MIYSYRWEGASPGSVTLSKPTISLVLMPGKTYKLNSDWDVVRQWEKNGLLARLDAFVPKKATAKKMIKKEAVTNAD